MSSDLDIALPKSWNWSPLKFVTTFLNRGTAPDYVDDGPVRVVSQAANQSVGLDWERTRFHDHAGDPKRLKGYLLPGDVIINSTGTGTLGRVGYFVNGPDGLPCVADGHLTIARADRQLVEPRFLYYWLSCKPFYDYIYSALVVGATNQIELNRERLAAAPTAFPSLEEQRHIADFLDVETTRLDRLTVARRRMLALLELRRERMVENTLGLDASPPLVPLKYAVRSVSVGIVINPSRWYVNEGGVPAVRGINVRPGLIQNADLVQISHAGHLENLKSRLSAGNVVVVRTGQAGAAAVVLSDLEGCNCIDLLIIRPGDRTNPSFLSHFLNSRNAQDKISELSVGSIQAHFNVGAMKNLAFPMLELAEQERRASALDEVVSDIDSLNRQIEAQLALLAERRLALITAAVTGQIDVTAARGVAV